MSNELDAETDVVVIGSGFGGSTAALRFAEAGERVTVLERGPFVRRESFEVDLDALWNPMRHRFGMNDFRPRGDTIIPWLGAGVGGGSHVYAATLKRREHFDDFPPAVAKDTLDSYYDRAEDVMGAARFPEHSPYGEIRATQLLYEVGRKLRQDHPDLVEDWGPINLGISFAPPDGSPGQEFVNKHGATQRYSDPREQSLLGGDIDSKNSLDRNYLHLAQQRGASIRALCQADRIEPLAAGGYRVHYQRYVPETGGWRRRWIQWSPWSRGVETEPGTITARRVVVAAGAVGSTELLLRNRDVHQTLPELSAALGQKYTTNGDTFTFMFPFRGIFLSWAGLLAAVVGLVLWNGWIAAAGALAYYAGLWISRRSFDPDIGPTNSDYIRFKSAAGEPQGVYIEGGRYPTPVRLLLAIGMSVLGVWRPRRYGVLIRVTNALRKYVPPFELLARSWPIPLLTMGKDHALGSFELDAEGRVIIQYDKDDNEAFYAYIEELGRMVARAAGAWWMPNPGVRLLGKLEVPHNQGGCPMAESPREGVVDHAGRVFGYTNLMVLDGSIIPVSPGPNPALTILALSERAMEHILGQIRSGQEVQAVL